MKKMLSVLLVFAMLFSGAAYAGAEEYRVGILAPDGSVGWAASVAYFAEQRCIELGADYMLMTGGTDAELSAQMDELLQWGAQAIVVYPFGNGLDEALQKAMNAGVAVINANAEIDVAGAYRVVGDDYDMGVQSAYYIAEMLEGAGSVIVLDASADSAAAQARLAGFLDAIGEIAPDVELTATYTCQPTRASAASVMGGALADQQFADAIFAPDDEISLGALDAMDAAGRSDIRVLTGAGGCQAYLEEIQKRETLCAQTAIYSPNLFADAVDIALRLCAGDPVDPETIVPAASVDRANASSYLDPQSPY